MKTGLKKGYGKVTKEAHAYTPGLKVKRAIVVRKVRKLPIQGEVYVKVGEQVDFDTVIAKTEVPGDPYVVRASEQLGLDDPSMLRRFLIKKEGDLVKKDEVVAKDIAFFGLIKKFVRSPVDGVIESISDITGQMIIREPPVPVEVRAYIPGRVVEVLPGEGAVIETTAAFIQGIFGIGGETNGEIEIVADSPKDQLTEDDITSAHKGKIIIGGSLVTGDALSKALEVGVRGVVVGGIRDTDLINLLGYEIGVAITGHEEIGLTLIITEGFGEMAMSSRTFNLLKLFEGERAAINGETQIRAGVIRPEIIIPHNRFNPTLTTSEELVGGMRPGTPIRVIRAPYFGRIGRVVSLPVELQKIETESHVRVVEIELEDGRRVIVPRANVEIIEE